MRIFEILRLFVWVHIINVMVDCSTVFNVQVSARVEDFLTDYLTLMSRSIFGPYNTVIDKNIQLNLSNPIDTSRKILFQTRQTFKETSNIYVALENGLFYGYVAHNFQVDIANVPKRYSSIYSVNSDGSPGQYLSNLTYDHRTRPWYLQI